MRPFHVSRLSSELELFACPTVSPTTVEDDVMINSVTGLLSIQQILESEVAVGSFFLITVSPSACYII